MSLFEKINDQIKTAMKAKDEKRLSVVRMLKSKLLLVNDPAKMTDDEVQSVIVKYAKSLKETIAIARQNNQEPAAQEAESELAIVKEFLPEELTEEQLKTIIKQVITEVGATSPADMGKVMKAAMPKVKGADGSIVKNIVLAALTNK